MSFWPDWHENKPFSLGLLVLLTFLVMFLWVKIDLIQRQAVMVNKPVPYEHSIVVEGKSKVTGAPNIATVMLTIDTKAGSVVDAQKLNTTIVNKLLEKLKDEGVSKEDIQTSYYSSYENFEWNQSLQKSVSIGWIVSQQLTVKIRDLKKIGDVLEVAGQNGVTNISGPNLTLDDQSHLEAEARLKAIEEASVRARDLEKRLGVRLERVIGYSEWTEGPQSYNTYYAKAEGMGVGGAPEIEPGSVDLTLHVSLTYKLVE